MISFGTANFSRYLRTSWMLRSHVSLKIPGIGSILFLSDEDVKRLSSEISKRNVFARHSWENNFYLQRITELSEKTVLEVFLPGTPNEMYDEATRRADLLEQLIVLTTTLSLTREKLHYRLGLHNRSRTEIDFTIGPDFRYLKSRTKDAPNVIGLIVDDRFCRRFERLNFNILAAALLDEQPLPVRVRQSLQWLFTSRLEIDSRAAVIKTSIALESLLIFSGSEPLANSLSERTAFILSTEPEIRAKLSGIVKKFYDTRSKIVHGSKKSIGPSSNLLEAVDRICLMLCLSITANPEIWKTQEALHEWCNKQKWGYSPGDLVFTVPRNYVAHAIRLADLDLKI